MFYCRLIYMLSILCVRLTIKIKVGMLESFKVEWYPPKKLGRVTLSSIQTEPDNRDRVPLSFTKTLGLLLGTGEKIVQHRTGALAVTIPLSLCAK